MYKLKIFSDYKATGDFNKANKVNKARVFSGVLYALDLLQAFVFVYPSVTRTLKFELETYRSSLYHNQSGVRGIVSEKHYPYIIQQTKGLGESMYMPGLLG